VRKLLVVLAAAVVSLSAQAKSYTLTGKATWHATGEPGIVSVDGDGGHVTGQADEADGKITGTFVVQLKDYKTGMDSRDEHLHKKYLQDDKWPEARLVLQPWPKTSGLSAFSGDLTLHGVTKPVTGKAAVSADNKLHAEFTVNLLDYGIEKPKMGPVTVKPAIAVTVDAEVQ
jgi:polyisoprenoid-binding protein YceI